MKSTYFWDRLPSVVYMPRYWHVPNYRKYQNLWAIQSRVLMALLCYYQHNLYLHAPYRKESLQINIQVFLCIWWVIFFLFWWKLVSFIVIILLSRARGVPEWFDGSYVMAWCQPSWRSLPDASESTLHHHHQNLLGNEFCKSSPIPPAEYSNSQRHFAVKVTHYLLVLKNREGVQFSFFSQCSNFNKTHKENVTQGGEMILRSQSGQKQHIHLPVTLPLLSDCN